MTPPQPARQPTKQPEQADNELDTCTDCHQPLYTLRGLWNRPLHAVRHPLPWMPPEGCSCHGVTDHNANPHCRR